jgi:hypothetical protein
MKILLFVPLLVWMLGARHDRAYVVGCILWIIIAIAVWRWG